MQLLLQIERETGKQSVRVSYRTLAERLGRQVSVIHYAINRLHGQGALEVNLDHDGMPMFSVPNSFLDLSAKQNNLTHLLDIRERVVERGSIIAGHDAYRHEALGHYGAYLVGDLNSLKGKEFSLTFLKQRKYSYRYLVKALGLLMQCGLVEAAGIRKLERGRPEKLYKAKHIGSSELDRIAEQAGTKGEQKRQKRHYQDERLIYASFLASKKMAANR